MNKIYPPPNLYQDINFSEPVTLSKSKINWRKFPLKKAFFIAWIISPIPFGIPAAAYFLGRESFGSLQTIFNRFRRKEIPLQKTLDGVDINKSSIILENRNQNLSNPKNFD